MFPIVVHEKAKLKERTCVYQRERYVVIGDEVVPNTYDYYSIYIYI